MPIRYADAKKILAQYAGRSGKCTSTDSEEVDLFTREVLQYMLISGAYGKERTYCFQARSGCITLPYELEVPLKVKIDDIAGDVWDRWFQFYANDSAVAWDGSECVLANRALQEEPNLYPTVYDLPHGGARVAVIATAHEEKDAQITVQGLDNTGREVVTSHEGKQVYGEVLRLVRGEFRYTEVTFSKITGVEKSRTVGYVNLLAYDPATRLRTFLSDYTPLEENPAYRRYRLTFPCKNRLVKVSVLGRIRIKDRYADNEFIPFDNLLSIRLAGQYVNAHVNSDLQAVDGKSKSLDEIITKEANYKKPTGVGQPVEVFQHTSGGHIRNIIGH